MARGDILPRRNLPTEAEPWGRKVEMRLQEAEKALSRAETAIVAGNRAQNNAGVVVTGVSNLATLLDENAKVVDETMIKVAADLAENDLLLAENKVILEAAQVELAANKLVLEENVQKLVQLNEDLVTEAAEREEAISAVEQAISDLNGTVEGIDGGPTVSPDAPTAANGEGKKNGALWYRVDGQKNVVGTWRWTGTAWDPVTFGPGSISAGILDDIATAKTNAQNALTGAGNANLAAQTADGKLTWSLSAPVAADGKLADGRNRAEGSTWYHRDAANNVIGIYRWNGTTTWVSQPLNAGAIANNAITSDKLANAVTTSITQAQTTAGNAQTAATNAATAASEADQKARDAAGLAATKGKTIIQSAAPAAEDRLPQNLWIDTTGGANTPKRWTSGTTWTPVTDKAATDAANAAVTAQGRADAAFTAATNAATAAGNAQTAADGKSTVWYLSTAPAGTGHKVGDTWFDTGNGNRIMRWSGSAWVSALIGNGAISDLAISNAKLADNAVNAAKILNGSVTSDQLSNAVNTTISTAQQTATNAATAAADAKSYANSVLMSAENVIIDGAFSQGQWKSAAGSWILDVSTGRGDSYCLRKNGFASTSTYPLTVDAAGNTTTIPVNPGETWEVSGWYRTSADWNGSQGNSKLRLANQANQPVGPGGSAVVNPGWTQVGGRLTIGSTVTALQLSIVGDNTVGAILWDDISLKNVTAAVAAETIAGAANTAAGAAQTAADNAKTIADRAETTANGKNKNIRSTAVASGAGVNGDQWWQYAGTQVIGMWIHNGSTWVAQTLTDSVITNLNAGTITSGYIKAALIESGTITGTHIAGTTITAANMVTGTITAASGIIANAAIGNAQIANLAVTNAKIADATIQSAKIGSVDAETITVNKLKGIQIEANTITGNNILAGTIGTAKLMIGDFEDLFEDRSLVSADAWTGTFSLTPRSSPNQAANMMVIVGAASAVNVISTKVVDVLGGEKIAVNGQVYTSSGVAGGVRIFARVTLANGSSTDINVLKTVTPGSGTDDIPGVINVPANAVKLRMGIGTTASFTNGQTSNWHSLTAKFQKPSTLIEDGSIITEKMTVNSILGDRIKAGTMEADKLVAGSITSAQIKAGSIFADSLAIGNFDNLLEDPNLTIPLSTDTKLSAWNSPEGSMSNWMIQNNAAGFNPPRTLRGTAAAGAQRLANRNLIAVSPGDRLAFSARINSSLNTDPQIGIVWRTETKGLAGSDIRTVTTTGTEFKDVSFISTPAPVNAFYGVLEVRTSTATTGAANFGNLRVESAVGRTVIQDGAIGTDQIEALSIVAGKIAVDAVTADKIKADAVTADKIKANSIDSDKIATAGLSAGVITFGEMSGARIQANTISASKLVIGDFTNLVDDPYYTLGLGAPESEWIRRSGSTAATSIATTTGLPGPAMTLRGVSTEVSVWTRGSFQVQPGQNYRVDFRVQNNLTGSAPISYVRVYWYQKDGTTAATGTQSPISVPGGTSWTDSLGATVTAPANAAFGRIMLIHGNNNTGGTWWIGNIAVRRTTGATLIDDKSISTNSIVTEGLNANVIAFGTMHGDRITVNTLNGDRITTNTLDAEKIVTGSITTNKMTVNTINGDRIVTNTLNADKIVGKSITADKIAGNTITADQIKGQTITASELNAAQINGLTLTGNTIQTSASGTRVVMEGVGSQNGVTVYTGSTSQVRIGYGIANGLEIRNPVTNALTELAPVIFGSTSSTIGQSMAAWRALGWPWTAPVMSTGPIGTKYQVDMPGSTFTALTNRLLISFSAEANFYIGSMNAAAVYLSLIRTRDNFEWQIPIIFFVQRLGNEPQSKMHFLSKTGITSVERGETYRLQGCAITRANQAGDSPAFNYAQPNGVDIGQLVATVQSI